MRAVVNLRDDELAERRSKGLDRWDEMWEGVLHMTPAPSVEHQRIVSAQLEFSAPASARCTTRRTGLRDQRLS